MRLLLGAIRLFVYRALWYWLGITSAGHALVRALGSPDENIRSIAGILLTKRRFADDQNPDVAKAAQEALKVIEFSRKT